MTDECAGIVPEAEILMADGQMKKAVCMLTGETIQTRSGFAVIEKTLVQKVTELYEVYCLDNHCIRVSGDFYFQRVNKRTKTFTWVKAKELAVGEWLVTENGMISIVSHVEKLISQSAACFIYTLESCSFYVNGFLTKTM